MTFSISGRVYGGLLLAIVSLQLIAGLIHIGEFFNDGRYHYNWGPPFWLEHARATNDAGLAATYFGVAGYRSHPQLLGPVAALWTNSFGYSEYAIRFLALSLAMITTTLLALSTRRIIGNVPSLIIAATFAALPIIYIYGKKLDQENLLIVFLVLQLWGYLLLREQRRRALILIGASSFLMMSSDWSGAVLAVALWIGSGVVYGWRGRFKELRQLALVSGGATFLALLLFVLQSALQAHLSLGGLMSEFTQQWIYRLGTGDDAVTPFWWLYRQYFFTMNNFSIPLFLGALVGLALSFRRHVQDGERAIAVFAVAVFCGSLAYQLAVSQASGVHIYYQFYYALPVAIGLYLLARHASELFPQKRDIVTIVLALLFVIAASLWSAYQYYSLIALDSSGEDDDIELLMSLRAIPPGVQVVAAQSTSANKAWFENPNIRYYAGRDIATYLLKDGVQIAPYQIIPLRFAKDYLAQINVKHGYGKAVSARLVECSSSFCLLHLHYPKQ